MKVRTDYYSIDDRGVQTYSQFQDIDGKPVEKTPYSHPYSYDGYVIHRCGRNAEINGSVWSDRMGQWDAAKQQAAFDKHLKGKYSGGFNSCSPADIQAYLRDYLDQPDLKLIVMMNYCNVSSGYPVWRFDFHQPQ